jgi:phenylalanyl-tRNA synthetase beta chain
VLSNSNRNVKVEELSKFPSVYRDLALLVNADVTFEELHQIALKTERQLLENVQLFDVFTGNGIPKGKKSYGLNFKLSDKNKTLTDKQIDKTMKRISQQYEKQLGASLR